MWEKRGRGRGTIRYATDPDGASKAILNDVEREGNVKRTWRTPIVGFPSGSGKGTKMGNGTEKEKCQQRKKGEV